MTTLATYGLEEFAADMKALVASQPNQKTLFDRGSVYMERLIRNPNAIPEEFQRPLEEGKRPNHGSYALHRSEGLFISSVVWGPGDFIKPHDHRTWGMIGFLKNMIQETRYRRVDDRSREGFARLEKDRAMLMKPGEVCLLVPEEDEIHRLDNFSDRPTVEVHVYGKDLVGLPRYMYDLDTGKMVPFASDKFDNC
jgi:predicted metal-dependent enzyme (double-stranded beta helix superfamily)